MYPKQVSVFGHIVDVKVFSDPLEVVQDSTSERTGYVLGMYDPNTTTISVTDVPDKPAVSGSNFIHELIEAIDCHGDLNLTHTQISTLSSALYQALASGEVNFGLNCTPNQRESVSQVWQ